MNDPEPRNKKGDTFTEAKMRSAMTAIDAIRDSGLPSAPQALLRIMDYASKKRTELQAIRLVQIERDENNADQ